MMRYKVEMAPLSVRCGWPFEAVSGAYYIVVDDEAPRPNARIVCLTMDIESARKIGDALNA